MPTAKVESSSMTVVRYNRKNLTLEIHLKDGSRYKYTDVPFEVYDSLINAESKGRFFNQHIRNEYNFVRL